MYSFITAKSKTKAIHDFIELFGNNIKLFETYQSKLLPEIMKREQALKRALTDEEQAIIYAEILNKTNIEAYKTLSDTYAKPDTKISSQKKMQQYYTSPELANYIINLSSIRKNNSKIDILEPTAGEGTNFIIKKRF